MLRDLSDTLTFVKVVQTGSFSNAARALGVPKTRVSRKVQALEQRLGVQLLKRTTRKLGLTEAGGLYFHHCETLARGLEDAEDAVAALRSGPRGWLRVAAPYWLSCSVLGPLLGDFRALHPDIRVELVMGHELVDLVTANVDIAFRLWRGPLPDSGLTARRLGTLTMRAHATDAYVRKYGQPRSPEELIMHRTLATSVSRGKKGYAWWMHRGRTRAEYPIDPTVIASDPEVLIGFMLAGQGIMQSSELRMRSLVAQGQVRTLLPEWSGPDPNLFALMPGGRAQPAKVRAFLDFLTTRLELG